MTTPGGCIAYVEPEPGWAPLRITLTHLENLGYHVTQAGAGDYWRLYLSYPVRWA